MARYLVRTKDGRMVHHPDCRFAKNCVMWEWSVRSSDEYIFMQCARSGIKLCKVCDPVSASKQYYWYGSEGGLITKADAKAIMSDDEKRTVKKTKLLFIGYELFVSTVFTPIDHGETFGTYTRTPACWLTEIVGGPPDLDGMQRYSTSSHEALELHEEIVEMAVASGCIVAE